MSEKVYRSELTPVDFLRRSAYMFPEKTAVVYGDRRYTYRELEERVNRLASRLRDAGLEKGDRVAFLCPNTPPMLEGHFGVPAAGLILVAINTASARTRSRTSSSTRGRRWSSWTPSWNTCSRTSKTSSGCASTTRARQEILTRITWPRARRSR